jgi:hypothetical protein
MTAVYAGASEGSRPEQKEEVGSSQTGTSAQPAPKQDSASRYNKAKIERNKRAREKSDGLKSGDTVTFKAAPAKSGSSVVERDKKRYETRKRAADRRTAEMKKADKSRNPVKSGSSVVERDKTRYDAKKRAEDKRAAEMKKADKASTNTDAVKKDPNDAQEQPPAK